MEEAPENGKESLHSAHANGMTNECMEKKTLRLMFYSIFYGYKI
jgi:hypothetical protein